MKVIYFILILFLISMSGYAQYFEAEEEEPEQEEAELEISKFYYGGYMNLSFGTFTVVGLTPLIGYKISPRLSIGSQFSYEYVKDKSYSLVYETSNYGFSFFGRYRVMPQLYTHVEFSQMNYKSYYTDGSSFRKWVPFLWLGGGYSQPIGPNTWFNTQILFDVINNESSPYYGYEPYFTVGFGVGF